VKVSIALHELRRVSDLLLITYNKRNSSSPKKGNTSLPQWNGPMGKRPLAHCSHHCATKYNWFYCSFTQHSEMIADGHDHHVARQLNLPFFASSVQFHIRLCSLLNCAPLLVLLFIVPIILVLACC
jgi:hypothetical protein